MTVDTADVQAHAHARATVRPDKAAVVNELAEAFRTSTAAVLTEYRGLSVKQVTALRVALGAGTTYSVVKNTLTRLAAADAGMPGLDVLLTGPTAVAFVNGDPVEAAKGLREFARANPALVVKGGVLDGKTLSADEVRRLADLDSREVLLAKLAGAMKASLTQAVYLLAAPLAQAARLAGALQAKAQEDPSIIGGAGSPSATSGETGETAAVDPAAQGAPEATAADGVTAAETDTAGSTDTDTAGTDTAGTDSTSETGDSTPETA